MDWTIPPGTVAYEEGAGASASAALPEHRLEMTDGIDLVPEGRWGPYFCSTCQPACWARFHDALLQISRFGVVDPLSVVFLHERRSPLGSVRLVMVEFCPYQCGWFRCNLVVPGTKQAPATAVLTTTTLSVQRTTETDVLQVFAGQPDPANPSHFTIECRFNGSLHVIDGDLLDDDHVFLKPRSGAVQTGRDSSFWWPKGDRRLNLQY